LRMANSQKTSFGSKSKNDGDLFFSPKTDQKMSSFPLPKISEVTDAMREKIQAKIDSKTKPIGSLGVLEEIALQIASVQETLSPKIQNPTLIIFAADHGITEDPVSLYPKEVTWQMVNNFLLGGACANVFANFNKIQVKIVDAGVDHEWEPIPPNLIVQKIGRGTKNFKLLPAMDRESAENSLQTGINLVSSKDFQNSNFFLFGEMGIGNTSSASLIHHCLSGIPLEDLVGKGTGLNLEATNQKLNILKTAKSRTGQILDPIQVLSEYGGFEIGMMAGSMLGVASQKKIFMVDGFIATAAYLLAKSLDPNIKHYSIFSHKSDEAGHQTILKYLGVSPLLQLRMRLGEGSGALAAFPLVSMAVSFLNEMASFGEANVSENKTGG